jgi:cbb3-type cytochrome oxidase maturation protein
MEILYLLIPLSLILVFAIAGVFWWALQHRQFDDLEQQGGQILDDKD